MEFSFHICYVHAWALMVECIYVVKSDLSREIFYLRQRFLLNVSYISTGEWVIHFISFLLLKKNDWSLRKCVELRKMIKFLWGGRLENITMAIHLFVCSDMYIYSYKFCTEEICIVQQLDICLNQIIQSFLVTFTIMLRV